MKCHTERSERNRWGKKSFFVLLFSLFYLFCVPGEGLAKRDLEDEIQDFTVAQRAFQDQFYEFARQELEKFLEYYPHSVRFGQAKLLLGRTYLELGQPQKALTLFSEMRKDQRLRGLRDHLLYWSGEAHLLERDFERARTFYQALLKEYPESPMCPYALYSLGWCREAQMKFEQAEAHYQELLSRFPEHPLAEESSVRQIICFLRQKKVDETLKASGLFLEKYPTSAWKGEVLYLQGEVFFEKNDYPQAIHIYEEALREKGEGPWRAWARLNLGWSHLMQEEPEEALSLFKALVQEKRVHEAALFGMMRCQRFQNKPEEAILTLNQLLENATQDWRNKATLEKGKIQYQLSKIPEAVESFKTLLSNSPALTEAAEAHYGLGLAFLREDRFEEALSEFQWVAERSPEAPLRVQTLCRIGDIYQDRRNFQEALSVYQRVLNEYPLAPQADYAAYQVAASHLHLEEFSKAVTAYKDFLIKFEKSRYRFEARYELGMAHFHLGEYPQARDHFQRLVEAHPTDELYFSSLFQIGNVLYNLKAYKEALAIFQEMASEAPERFASLARYEMGWCFYQMGRRQQAVSTFQDYLSKYPGSDIAPDIHFWFAEYYERKKQYVRSEKHFERLLERYPKSPLLDEALFRWSGVVFERRAYERAIHLIDRLTKEYPDSPLVGEGLLRKNELLLVVKKRKEARETLDQILIQFPNSPFEKRASRRIGELLKEEKAFGEAIVYLEKAKTGDAYEPNAQIQFEIGECYEALGQWEKALEEFRRIAHLYPKSTYWVMRAHLKIGALFERQERWGEALKTYETLTKSYRLEEAALARERLKWIRENWVEQKTH